LYFLFGEFSPSVLIGEVDVLYLHIVLIAIPFGFLSQFGQSLLVARQHIIEFNVLDLFSRFLMFGGFALVLIVLNFGTREAAICFIAVTLITGIVYLARLSHYVKIRFRLARELVFPMLKYGMKAYLGSLLLFFVMRINIFVVNNLLGEYEVGLFSIPMQFLDVISLLPMTLGMLLFPKVAADDNDSGLLTAKVFRATFLLLTVICVLTALAGPLLVEFLFGSDFQGSVEPLIWLTPGILFLSLWMILNNDLAARGMPSIVMIAPAVALAGNLGVTLLLLDEFGMTSAAIGLSFASFIGFTLVFAHFIRALNIPVMEMLIFTKADFRSIFFRAGDSSA
jgi:O-antigen/teichoic acid export membrane protein